MAVLSIDKRSNHVQDEIGHLQEMETVYSRLWGVTQQ